VVRSSINSAWERDDKLGQVLAEWLEAAERGRLGAKDRQV
jgi:hypothetical protein